MRKVPAMSTRDSSAVLGSPTFCGTFCGTVLLPHVRFWNAESLLLPREQRFNGCSLKICEGDVKD